jgi:hypothetical protein
VSAAVADEPVVYDFQAGVACPFPLHVETGAASEPRELPGRNGDARLLRAGKGEALTFTNVDTSESVSLKANGSVQRGAIHPDGTSTWEVTGHNVIILFPTDVPAGPSTRLYVGRVLYTSTATNDFTVQQVSGSSVDICAELS